MNSGRSFSKLTRLGDLIDFRNDIVHPKDNPKGEAIFVGLEHVERNTGIRIGAEKVDLTELTGRRARFFAGDIVYGYLRPYLNKVWTAEFDGICSVDQYVFITRENVDRNYIAHFFRSEQFLKTAPVDSTPGQLPRIRSGEIADTPIALPPLNEQRRIAAILDKADALRRKRKHALDLLDNLIQSIFLEMFGSPESNPKGWKQGRISDLLEDTQYGTSEKAGEKGDYPILRMGNLTADGRMNFESLKYIDLDDKDLEKYTVRRGDILFNRTNSADLVGKTAVFDRDERFAFAGYLVRARVKKGVSPYYVASYLNSRHGKATLRGMAKSIVGMANINAKEMQSIPILIPDAKIQRAYSDALASIEALRAVSKRHMRLLDSSFSSLQSRAFSGQL
ncbi:restriction endonuclease subunit S [Rhodopseudomonas rhenobacensis]|nr:restriction endonuclease subunit S [Rhodopseudomonas rhenobacensis]